MKINNIHFIFLILISLFVSSCGINSSVMFKTPKNTNFKYDSIPMAPIEDYKISKDDKFTMYTSSNYGQNLINLMSGIADANNLETNANILDIEYQVDSRGEVNLPIIGKIYVEGLTIKLFEDTLSKLYSTIGGYKDPFTKLEVTNKRVIVFPGNSGDAKVVPIINNNTTLMEALAFTGGISERGKANSVKLIRKVNGKRNIYLIDLSNVGGLPYADMIVQANDYIYIEPNPRLGREVLNQIVPYLSIVTTLLIIYTVISK